MVIRPFLVFPQFISLTRPLDSHLEHVDFSSLLHCLHFEQIIQIFASAVLERKIIFLADGLRWAQLLTGQTGLHLWFKRQFDRLEVVNGSQIRGLVSIFLLLDLDFRPGKQLLQLPSPVFELDCCLG
jgi:hypothetical protein